MATIQVKVKPNAKSSVLALQEDGTYIASVKASPVDGKANAELIALIARHFRCPKSAITITAGASSRTKRVAIDEG